MVNIRKVKDDHEIDLIRKSVAIAEEAFTRSRVRFRSGKRENYLAGLVGFGIREPRGERQQLSGDRGGRSEQQSAALSAGRYADPAG